MSYSQHKNQVIQGMWVKLPRSSRSLLAVSGVAILVVFGSLNLVQAVGLEPGRWFGPCGFQQRHGLPCPTCGITTATLAFARGKIYQAFKSQPAAAIMCLGLFLAGSSGLMAAVMGKIPRPIWNACKAVRPRWLAIVVLMLVIVIWLIRLVLAWPYRT